MDLRQLRYFVTVANEGQVTSAAKLLNMEQPPLSRQLKLMEQELAVQLFDRSGNRLKLTHAGELLRQRAAQLLQQFNDAVVEVKELDQGITGTLSIGSVMSCISLLPPRISSFMALYPLVTYKIIEGDHILLGEQLEQQMIELAVTRLPFEAKIDRGRIAVRTLPSDPFVAILPDQWLSASSDKQKLSLKELSEHPLLTLKSTQTTGMHEQVVNEFRLQGLEPQILCECSSVAIILALVASGIGGTVLPKSVIASFAIPNVQVFDVPSASSQSEVGIIWLKDRYLSKSAREFIERF